MTWLQGIRRTHLTFCSVMQSQILSFSSLNPSISTGFMLHKLVFLEVEKHSLSPAETLAWASEEEEVNLCGRERASAETTFVLKHVWFSFPSRTHSLYRNHRGDLSLISVFGESHHGRVWGLFVIMHFGKMEQTQQVCKSHLIKSERNIMFRVTVSYSLFVLDLTYFIWIIRCQKQTWRWPKPRGRDGQKTSPAVAEIQYGDRQKPR